jgi:hypothetical protein
MKSPRIVGMDIAVGDQQSHDGPGQRTVERFRLISTPGR